MSAEAPRVNLVQGYCGLCIARCGTIATVTDGRFIRLDPDPTHPTGAAICAKGRAAPELVYHKDRLRRPLRRTRPKGNRDPGWEEISWDAALDQIADAMRRTAAQHGPEAVAFSQSSGSTTAIADSAPFVRRLMNAFGTPNLVWPLDLCGWGRGFATRYVFGVGSVAIGSAGGAMPDIAKTGCLILWGYNPSFSRITHATAAVSTLKRGMKLIVVDPRQVGLANKADIWLRVRPGTDGALALGLASVMIERGWYDREFVRAWSNGPLLVRSDTNRLLKAEDVAPDAGRGLFTAWNAQSNCIVRYDPIIGRYDAPSEHLALEGEYAVSTSSSGVISCRPVFDRYAALCRRFSTDFIFGLAQRLGLGEQFWDGDIDAAYREQLDPSGITLEQLRAQPAGLRTSLMTTHRKHAVLDGQGNPRGFQTPSRKVEFWSETFLDRGYSALPDVVEPARAGRFPLILTCAKPSLFCQSQHRALPSLRKRAPNPEIELHPATAAARGIQNGDWVEVRTLTGAMRAKARFSETLDPRVVVGEHGWWQGCDELGAVDSDPLDPNGTNFNLTVNAEIRDPISGTPSHRSNVCEIELVRASRDQAL
jgi:anaerobic selenocysteine-containing dehydrogenase